MPECFWYQKKGWLIVPEQAGNRRDALFSWTCRYRAPNITFLENERDKDGVSTRTDVLLMLYRSYDSVSCQVACELEISKYHQYSVPEDESIHNPSQGCKQTQSAHPFITALLDGNDNLQRRMLDSIVAKVAPFSCSLWRKQHRSTLTDSRILAALCLRRCDSRGGSERHLGSQDSTL